MITEELKNEVIYSDDATRLFKIMLDANEAIAKLFIELAKSDNQIEMAELRGQISIYKALLNIIDKRIDDVKADENEKSRKELHTNRHFRMVAETVLTKDTYNRIRELSHMQYKQYKDMKAGLKANKLE